VKIESHFKFDADGSKKIVSEAISKAERKLSGFFSDISEDYGFSFYKVNEDIWCLSGDAVFVFKVLSLLSEQKNNISKLLAVDTYRDRLVQMAARETDTYKYRFNKPYFLKITDKKTGQILNERDGPYDLKMAKDIKNVLEGNEDEVFRLDEKIEKSSKIFDDVIVDMYCGSIGYETE
jgi:hypothetical protein